MFNRDTVTTRQIIASLQRITAAVETVEDYAADTINLDGTVDTEALDILQFGTALKMLEELDSVANTDASDYGQAAFIDDIQWLIEETQQRAERLAKVVRLAVSSPAARKAQ